jgi:hypothetical protein
MVLRHSSVTSDGQQSIYLRVSRPSRRNSATFAAGENAMIVVVEIISRTGTRASKEYDAPSYSAAIEAVKRELRAYPTFRVTNIRIKDDGAVQGETAEVW